MPSFLRSTAIAIALSAAVLLAVCAAAPAGQEDDGDRKQLVLGVHPYLSPTELMDRFGPLAAYLGMEAGREVVVNIARDYNDHIDMIGQGKVDIAYMGPASYVTLVTRYGRPTILATHELNGKSSFRGVIIARKGSGIVSLGDLKGRKFAFGDPSSTMSHLVPRAMLLEAGVDVSALSGYEHLRNHDNVALGVLVGDFDAGAVKEETFYKYRSRGLDAVAFSPAVSEHLFVARKGLPDDMVRKIREAMHRLSADPDDRGILEGLKPGTTGLVNGSDADYEGLRLMLEGLRKAGIDP